MFLSHLLPTISSTHIRPSLPSFTAFLSFARLLSFVCFYMGPSLPNPPPPRHTQTHQLQL
jgi:hypothetical protein